MLPHMLAHYRNSGITSVMLKVHLRYPGDPVLEEARQVARRFGCDIAATMTGGVWTDMQNAVHARISALGTDDWYIFADQDEFHCFPAHDKGVRG